MDLKKKVTKKMSRPTPDNDNDSLPWYYGNAWDEGFAAAKSGKHEKDNPYSESEHERDTTFSDELHYWWYCGWNDYTFGCQ